MQKLKIQLKNCYGINLLEKDFDFSKNNTYVIYSQNGTMKSSFAKVFKDITEDKDSMDIISPEKQTVRNITDENDTPLAKDSIMVVEPYVDGYVSNKISTLLVNKDLKTQYDQIYKDINIKKDQLIKELKLLSGLPIKNVESIFSKDIIDNEKDFFIAILSLKKQVDENSNERLSKIIYKDIFNDKVENFLKNKDFKNKLNEYITIYNDLVSKSCFFRKGVFDNYNAAEVQKSLNNNNFFNAQHTVLINQQEGKKEISSATDFEQAIKNEKEKIFSDEKLKNAFNLLDDTINSNKDLRNFKLFVENNQDIIPRLNDTDKLKIDLWVSYLANNLDKYNILIQTYQDSLIKIKKITEQALSEKTKWQETIDIFNKRFSVPFKLSITNATDAILGIDVPITEFEFIDLYDTSSSCSINGDLLLKVLSQGELRALYILNIIFEIEARKQINQQTIMIVDDIADSFDYKNKYAIIEYLKEISETTFFYQIILTHNFDFYRTISKRFDFRSSDSRSHKLHSIKTKDKIILKPETYQNNVFLTWLTTMTNTPINNKEINKYNQRLIALIPFVRNISEYSKGEDSSEYIRLTSMLHYKHITSSLKISDFQSDLTNVLCRQDITLINQTKNIVDLICETANEILLDTSQTLELESKIVLSIAIRLKAEEYMIHKINDNHFVNNIKGSQTRKLTNKFKEQFITDSSYNEIIEIIDRVNLMTPENIHLNSFMYEPILDMSNDHLKELYRDIKKNLSLVLSSL